MTTRMLLIAVMVLGATGIATAQSGVDPFEGAGVTADSGTIFPATAMFSLTGGGTGEDGTTTIFNNGGGVHFVEFQTASPVTISGVTAYTASDGNVSDGFRGTSFFDIFVDLDVNGSFETNLASGNPVDDGTGATFSFSPITGSRFRAEFTGDGPRVRELDAIAFVPEPGSMSLAAIGAASLLLFLRRRASRL